MRSSGSAYVRGWLVSAGVVTFAWAAGASMWDMGGGSTDDVFREASFSLAYSVLPYVAIGLPIAIIAGRARARAPESIGSLALAAAVIVLSVMGNMSQFGGACIDQGDPCLVSFDTRLAGIVGPLACLAIGCLTELVVRRKRTAAI